MKVLYFHQHFSTPSGATGIRSYEMALKLIGRGHEVIMVCGSYNSGQTRLAMPFKNGMRRGFVDKIDVIEFDLSYSNSDSFAQRLYTFIWFALRSIVIVFNEKYDIVFATSTPLTAGIPGIFAKWFKRKPFVFEIRDLWPELPKAMGVIRNPLLIFLMSLLEWLSCRSANSCIGLSPGIVKGIKRLGVTNERVTLISNGCDLSIFSKQKHSWRPDNVAETDLMAVFAGTHGVANGLNSVLDAACELQRRGRKDIKIVLVGQGKLKSALQKRAKILNLDNVLFHKPINKARLAGLLTSADLGLQILANVPAFYYGTSPNKFFDYIAAGLPVVNNYPGWISEIITSHRCGFTVKPDCPVSFADSLEDAANNPKKLKSMGVRSLNLARREFNRDILGEKFVGWLESTLN